MDLNQQRYFILSGAISIGMFVLLLFLIGYSFLKSMKIEQFAMTQSEFISVSIDISPIKAEAKTKPQPVQSEPEPISEPVNEPVKPQEEAKPDPVPDISDLFSQVKTQKSPKKPIEDTKRTDQLNALEKELLSPTKTAQLSEKVKNLDLIKPSVKMVAEGGSSGPVVNEYHAKIQGLVHMNFHPPQGTEGQVSRVQVKISAAGKLIWFKVKARSGNQPYDNEVQWLKERLEKVVFPPHPENRDTILEFILRAKE